MNIQEKQAIQCIYYYIIQIHNTNKNKLEVKKKWFSLDLNNHDSNQPHKSNHTIKELHFVVPSNCYVQFCESPYGYVIQGATICCFLHKKIGLN